tara:strand:+ start:1972 stop:2964 length:993 start_codon:yes stop_codon:yes gene_type:complete
MLKWCIIGSGDVIKRLVQDSLNIKNKSKVECILSDDLTQAKDFAKKHNIKDVLLKSEKNIKKIINNSDINSIYIATPPNSHLFYISKFCKTKKNIVSEKPLVTNKKELARLKTLLKKYKFNLFTCFYRRYLKKFIFIKELLNKKILGKILYFDIKYFHDEKTHPTAKIIKGKPIPWRFVKKISGGGNVVDMGVHAIDLVEFMIGKIKKISSFKTNKMNLYKVEDICVINFELKNKILGQSSWCSVSNNKKDEFSIYGSKASIHFTMNMGEDEKITIYKDGKKKIRSFKMIQPLHKNMLKYFVNRLEQNNKKNRYEIRNDGLVNSYLISLI